MEFLLSKHLFLRDVSLPYVQKVFMSMVEIVKIDGDVLHGISVFSVKEPIHNCTAMVLNHIHVHIAHYIMVYCYKNIPICSRSGIECLC